MASPRELSLHSNFRTNASRVILFDTAGIPITSTSNLSGTSMKSSPEGDGPQTKPVSFVTLPKDCSPYSASNGKGNSAKANIRKARPKNVKTFHLERLSLACKTSMFSSDASSDSIDCSSSLTGGSAFSSN